MADTEQLLRDLLEQVAREQGYEGHTMEVRPASSGGANFTTQLFTVVLHAPGKPKLELFGKVAAFSAEFRGDVLKKYYDTENLFYTDLAKVFYELEEKHNITGDDRLVLPKIYGINTEFLKETMVLEDLGAAGFVQYDRFQPATWEYAASVVDELAKFHALSLAYGHERPDEYKKVLANLQFEIPAERQAFRKLCKGWLDGALEVAKEEYKERLVRFMDKYGDMEETTDFYAPLRRPVIAHGDFKITNFLHKVDDAGKYRIAVLDYQTLRAGSPVSDLIYFIFTGTDREFRRQHQGALVSRYRGQLAAALRRLDAPNSLYTDEDFHYEMKKVLPFGLTVAIYVLLVLLVRPEDAAAVNAGSDLSAFAMKPSPEYAERLNGILEDYAEWGIL